MKSTAMALSLDTQLWRATLQRSGDSDKENVYGSRGDYRTPAVHLTGSTRVSPSNSKMYDVGPGEWIAETELLARFGYRVQAAVGSGKYSRVLRAVDTRNTGNTVALKLIDTAKISSDFRQKFVPRERQLWGRLQHPHIVAMMETFSYGSVYCVSMEYVGGGDALSHVQSEGPLCECTAGRWMSQLLGALHYMHSLKIAHRDVKLENVLVVDSNRLKLCDFGFVREAAAGELSATYCGSKSYLCPQILAGVPYDCFKADVWALGVVGFISVTGCMPFIEHQGNAHMQHAQRTRDYRTLLQQQPALSNQYRMLIDRMLTYEEAERPSMCQLLADDYWPAATTTHSAADYY